MTDQHVTLRDFFDERFQRIDDQNRAALRQNQAILTEIAEVKAQVTITNGRVNGHDVKIAVLFVGYGLGAALLSAGAFWLLGKLP